MSGVVDVWDAFEHPSTTSSLQAWRVEAEAAAYIAGTLSRTPFVPDSLRVYADPQRKEGYSAERTAANVAAALLTGQEIGLAPMAALRSIDIVNGMPALRAIALRGLVLAAGHDMWLAESTNTRAIYRGKRKGSEHEQESLWDMDRARGLGLDGKKNWRAQPKAMLVARATAECARLVAPEAVLGLPYTAEELADGIEAPPEPERAAGSTTRRRTARRAVAPSHPQAADPPEPEAAPSPTAAVDDPELDEPESEPDEPIGDPPMITPAQRTAIHAAMSGLGIKDRDDRLSIMTGVTGLEVHSTLDLTADQASTVLDYLAGLSRQYTDDDEPPDE